MGVLLLILVVAATEWTPLTIAKALTWLVLIRSVPWVILVGEVWMLFSKGALWNQMRIDWWSQSTHIQVKKKKQLYSGYLSLMESLSSLHAKKASWFNWPITKTICALSYFSTVGLERERHEWAELVHGRQTRDNRHPGHSQVVFFGRCWPRDATEYQPLRSISRGSHRLQGRHVWGRYLGTESPAKAQKQSPRIHQGIKPVTLVSSAPGSN